MWKVTLLPLTALVALGCQADNGAVELRNNKTLVQRAHREVWTVGTRQSSKS
jgi:hypothetical protein